MKIGKLRARRYYDFNERNIIMTAENHTGDVELNPENKDNTSADVSSDTRSNENTETTTSAVEDPMTKLQAELDSWKSKYTYLYADYDNYRRRVARDIQTAREKGMESTIEPMLTVFDHFRMAMDASEKSDNIDKIREGLSLIFNEFKKAISDLGIEPIEALNTPFDPNIHEAISHHPSDQPEGVVIQQWSCGYQHNKKLVRPARVVVSSGPAKESKNDEA